MNVAEQVHASVDAGNKYEGEDVPDTEEHRDLDDHKWAAQSVLPPAEAV